MDSLHDHVLLAFEDELEKRALASSLRQVGKFLRSRGGAAGAGAGLGAAGGAAIGAGVGGLKSFREARDAGASGGQAAMAALGGGFQGALRGGAIGAGTGLAVGGLGGRRIGKALEHAALEGPRGVGSAARFGQRQLHSLTGYASPSQVRAMGSGATAARARMAQAVGDKATNQAAKALEHASRAEEAGITSLPGLVKGLAGRATHQGKRMSTGDVLKTVAGEQWHGAGLPGKALMVGLPAMSVADAAMGPSYDEKGRGRLERGLGGLVGGLAFSTPLSFAGQGAFSQLAGAVAGKGLGRAGDRAVEFAQKHAAQKRLPSGLRPPLLPASGPEEDEAGAGLGFVERVVSSHAEGSIP